MPVNAAFAEWARGFSGMDGGNLDARLWVSGIEPGGDEPPELWPVAFVHDRDGQSIPCWNAAFRTAYPRYLGYRFDQRVAKILVHLFGIETGCRDYGDYMRTRLYGEHDRCFKLNIYPLNAQRTDPNRWTRPYYDLTGLPTRTLYQAWCAEHRFPFIRALVERHAPAVIVATGSGMRHDFILAFAGAEPIFERGIVHQLVTPKSEVEEIVINGGRTRLLITPFLGQGGLMADADLESLAGLIRRFL